jgi:hypothetical protein
MIVTKRRGESRSPWRMPLELAKKDKDFLQTVFEEFPLTQSVKNDTYLLACEKHVFFNSMWDVHAFFIKFLPTLFPLLNNMCFSHAQGTHHFYRLGWRKFHPTQFGGKLYPAKKPSGLPLIKIEKRGCGYTGMYLI